MCLESCTAHISGTITTSSSSDVASCSVFLLIEEIQKKIILMLHCMHAWYIIHHNTCECRSCGNVCMSRLNKEMITAVTCDAYT